MNFVKIKGSPYLYVFLFFFSGLCIIWLAGNFSEGSAVQEIMSSSVAGVEEDFYRDIRHIDVNGIKVAYYDYSPDLSLGTVILLHGQRFSKTTWKDLGTLDKISESGYRGVAVDLPGYGESNKPLDAPNFNKTHFLMDLILKLDAGRPIIISPSMSGTYAVGLALNSPELISGWVPVAPVSLTSASVSQYEHLSLPVLAVYGEKDTSFRGQVEEYLGKIPGVTMVMISGASHPCYLDRPDVWHRALLSFLDSLNVD